MPISVELTCDLCNLPVVGNAYERTFGGEFRRFCCAGCLNVYSILSESGSLDQKNAAAAYRVGARLGLVGQPGIQEDTSIPLSNGAMGSIPIDGVEREIDLPIRGMWCASCAWLIERVLLKRQGVLSCQVSFVNDTARIRYNPAYISRQQILEEVSELGYEPGAPGGRASDGPQRELLIRFGVAAAPAMYMMMFNIVLYTGYFQELDPGVTNFLHQLLLLLSLPIVTYCAWPIYRRAWGALRQGTTTMETLITLGVGSAFLYSLYATIKGQKQVYYDTASLITTLVLLGKYIEAMARARATSALGSLTAMLPKKIRLRLPGGEERMVSAEQVQVGDQAIVDAGSTVPVDGVIIDGVGAFDESLLTGEPTPVRRGPGDNLVGASICVEGGVIVQAARTGSDTTISRMAHIVRDAVASRSGSERLADRIARVFVPANILMAVGVFLWAYLSQHAVDAALMRAISVLVIACPCALGMATPLAVAVSMGAAARRGILIRNSRALEQAQKIDTVVLDKTGTVTAGRLVVVETLAEPGLTLSTEEWEAIASLEALSQHPAARAIVTWIREQGYKLRQDVEMEIVPGKGIQGRVGSLLVFVGAREISPALSKEVDRKAYSAEEAGRTVVVASCEGRALCVFVLADVPRPGAAEAIRTLQAAGVELWLVSGDSETTTSAIARQLGIARFVSRALPEDKIEHVRKLRAAGKSVAMVGDGINDGPALAAANLGIAMGEGTQVALEAADIALLSPDLRRLSYAFGLSSRTVRIIRQNFFWAFIYNLLSIPAAAGLYGPRFMVGPLFAAAAMLTSSLSVVFNSLRLQRSKL